MAKETYKATLGDYNCDLGLWEVCAGHKDYNVMVQGEFIHQIDWQGRIISENVARFSSEQAAVDTLKKAGFNQLKRFPNRFISNVCSA